MKEEAPECHCQQEQSGRHTVKECIKLAEPRGERRSRRRRAGGVANTPLEKQKAKKGMRRVEKEQENQEGEKMESPLCAVFAYLTDWEKFDVMNFLYVDCSFSSSYSTYYIGRPEACPAIPRRVQCGLQIQFSSIQDEFLIRWFVGELMTVSIVFISTLRILCRNAVTGSKYNTIHHFTIRICLIQNTYTSHTIT